MKNYINGLDHIGLASLDMQKNEALFRQIGFKATQPAPLFERNKTGEFVELGQHSQHIIFAETYLELTGVVDHSKKSNIEHFSKKPDGMRIICLNTKDIEQAAKTMIERGIPIGKIQKASREVPYGKNGTALFNWFKIPQNLTPEGLVCIVEHVTPEKIFKKYMNTHRNNSTDLVEVTICTNSLEEYLEKYEKIFGTSSIKNSSGIIFDFGKSRVQIMEKESLNTRFPDEPVFSTPSFFAYTLRVKNISLTKKFFEKRKICYRDSGNKRIWLSPINAGGAVLEFQEMAQQF